MKKLVSGIGRDAAAGLSAEPVDGGHGRTGTASAWRSLIIPILWLILFWCWAFCPLK